MRELCESVAERVGLRRGWKEGGGKRLHYDVIQAEVQDPGVPPGQDIIGYFVQILILQSESIPVSLSMNRTIF